jgi:protein FrlC
MKSSLSTFVYYRYSLIEAIKRTKLLGFDGVEIWGGRPHAYWEDMTDERIAEVKRVLAELSLKISNFIPAQFRYPTNLAATDELIRQGSVNYIKRNIEVAEKLESPFVSLCPGFSLYGDTKEEAYQAMLKSFKEIHDFTKGMKIKLILEPAHAMETDLVLTTDDGMKVVDYFGKDKMGLCLDTGHLFVNKENLSDVVKKVKDYTVHWHIDDNFGTNDDHLVPGDGKIDFNVFLENLKKSKYSGFLAVELGFGYTNDPDPAVRRSMDFLKRSF